MDIKDVKELILTVDKTSVQKVDIQKGDVKISISKTLGVEKAERNYHDRVEEVQVQPVETKPEVKVDKIENEENLFTVTSPIVGTFYAAPSPDSEPYVKVGDKVKEGQTLCIIEAMKIMNEIESEASGEIVEILVKNEEAVEYGQPLMKIRRSS
ncbi:acetyl-CoA carboxylase biotin carboxyl carrier protein [Thermohalobacter berrensis]|uniref:Biotin carboxyl carrier protein of acetyl-CoA carboxylase n=1 Tax=Thermohalobacter berrensis TaxID=99594 RepID=A0A419T8N7_9FIRM|nr:acetyl-CoA carboxylase biotin carboxyl carrier protein [Thermohalobacter berrensis]RKD33910.1 acetyl-CoA carboxylase, biotin carboxyl carrier protein [Thermohalobacter berrensis]